MIQTIEAAIADKLKATTAVTDLVSTRIYANVADQNTEQNDDPYIVLITEDRIDEQTCDGVGISRQVLFTDIYDPGVQDIGDIAAVVRTTLQDYSGTHGSVVIQEMWQNSQTMARDDEVDKHVYRLSWNARIEIS